MPAGVVVPSVSQSISRSVHQLDALYQRTLASVHTRDVPDEQAFRVHLLDVAECCGSMPAVMRAWRTAEHAATRWYANAPDEGIAEVFQSALLALAVELQNANSTTPAS